MSSFCSSGSCEGYLCVGLLITTVGESARRLCGLCVLGCKEKVCVLEEVFEENDLVMTGNRYLIEPRKWPSTTVARLKTEYQPATIDFGACSFIKERIASLLARNQRKNIPLINSCLSEDGSTLMVQDTLHSLLSNGKTKETAICVDMPNCDLCASTQCRYKVQCDECSQFTCGSWIRLKSTCAYCRHHLSS